MDEFSDPTPIATAEQFKKALLSVRDREGFSPNELQMLKAHCRAPTHTISALKLAQEIGYPDYSTANLLYGNLAKNIAHALHYKLGPFSTGNPHWWRTLAYGNEGAPQNEDGHFEWVMRPELVQVLQEWKWA
jgi:hypothetical protein